MSKQSKILASLQAVMGGADAVKMASAQILNALGESPVDLLRAKAAQYVEMAELIEGAAEEEPEEEPKPKKPKEEEKPA